MKALPTKVLAYQPPANLAARGQAREWCVWDVIGVRACAGQYPGEKEITFPPYTCLESDGDARLERDDHGGEVIVFPLKVFSGPGPALSRYLPHCPSSRMAPTCMDLYSDCPAAAWQLETRHGGGTWRAGGREPRCRFDTLALSRRYVARGSIPES
jgi:hypothetical protein